LPKGEWRILVSDFLGIPVFGLKSAQSFKLAELAFVECQHFFGCGLNFVETMLWKIPMPQDLPVVMICGRN